jgi:hypothetical protein
MSVLPLRVFVTPVFAVYLLILLGCGDGGGSASTLSEDEEQAALEVLARTFDTISLTFAASVLPEGASELCDDGGRLNVLENRQTLLIEFLKCDMGYGPIDGTLDGFFDARDLVVLVDVIVGNSTLTGRWTLDETGENAVFRIHVEDDDLEVEMKLYFDFVEDENTATIEIRSTTGAAECEISDFEFTLDESDYRVARHF